MGRRQGADGWGVAGLVVFGAPPFLRHYAVVRVGSGELGMDRGEWEDPHHRTVALERTRSGMLTRESMADVKGPWANSDRRLRLTYIGVDTEQTLRRAFSYLGRRLVAFFGLCDINGCARMKHNGVLKFFF